MEKKYCTICGQELPLSQFPTNRGMKDGHLGKCYECFALFTGSAKTTPLEVKLKKRKAVEAEYLPMSECERRYRARLASGKWYRKNKERLKKERESVKNKRGTAKPLPKT